MEQGWANQYECPSVVLTEPRNPDEVIAFAREIGAECGWEVEPHEPPDLVIEFRYLNSANVGPEVYTEQTVRDQLNRDLTATGA